jgi:DNA-binding transcriptional LysR family regulator
MEMRQLRYFTVLAQELSFTRAAHKLHVSQPPLSFQIASLEEELGTRLFDRTSRSVQLNAAGHAFLPHAQAVLERLERARIQVKQVAQGFEGSVHIGLAGSHFLGPLPRFIAEFRQSRPKVEVVLHEMMPADHLQALHDGAVDISLLRSPSEHPGLRAQLLWRDPVVVALPLGHRLAARKRISLADLHAEALVMLRPGSSGYAQKVFDACAAAGFVPRVVQQVIEVPAMVNLVAAGLGVALVPASLAHIYNDAVTLCRLSGSTLNGDVYAFHRGGATQPAAAECLRVLIEWAKSHPMDVH